MISDETADELSAVDVTEYEAVTDTVDARDRLRTSPVKSPVKAPVKSPVKSRVKSRVKSPVKSPTALSNTSPGLPLCRPPSLLLFVTAKPNTTTLLAGTSAAPPAFTAARTLFFTLADRAPVRARLVFEVTPLMTMEIFTMMGGGGKQLI